MPAFSLANELSNSLLNRAPVSARKTSQARETADFGNTLAATRQKAGRETRSQESRQQNRAADNRANDERRLANHASKDALHSKHHDEQDHHKLKSRDAESRPRHEPHGRARSDEVHARKDVSRNADETSGASQDTASPKTATEAVSDSGAPSKVENTRSDTDKISAESATADSATNAAALNALQAQLAAVAQSVTELPKTPLDIQIAGLVDGSKPLVDSQAVGTGTAEEIPIQSSQGNDPALPVQAVALPTQVLSTDVQSEVEVVSQSQQAIEGAKTAASGKTALSEAQSEASAKQEAADSGVGKSFEDVLGRQAQQPEKTSLKPASTETTPAVLADKVNTDASVAATASKASEPLEQTKATPQNAALSRADVPVPLQAVAVEIGMRAMRGSKEFSIRLDPEDLGRIDITLEISEAGEVQAKLTVDRAETLQLLQRDSRSLERAFDQAGLKSNPDGLQFSLRDPNQQGQQGHQQQSDRTRNTNAVSDSAIAEDIAMKTIQYRSPASSGLDIRI